MAPACDPAARLATRAINQMPSAPTIACTAFTLAGTEEGRDPDAQRFEAEHDRREEGRVPRCASEAIGERMRPSRRAGPP